MLVIHTLGLTETHILLVIASTYTLTNIEGCDSTILLDLTINNSYSGLDSHTACDSYTWIDGNTYTSNNNTAMVQYTTVGGCDSTLTLDLIINQSSSYSLTETALDSYTLNGVIYDSTGFTPKSLQIVKVVTVRLR